MLLHGVFAPGRDVIDTAIGKRIATEYPPTAHTNAGEETVLLNGLTSVLRATRIVTAMLTKQRAYKQLIGSDAFIYYFVRHRFSIVKLWMIYLHVCLVQSIVY